MVQMMDVGKDKYVFGDWMDGFLYSLLRQSFVVQVSQQLETACSVPASIMVRGIRLPQCPGVVSGED